MKRFILFIIGAISCLMVSAQILSPIDEEKAEEGRRLDAEWVPTGVWPFINRRFQVAEVVTGFVTKKKTQVPCNIHIGKLLCFAVCWGMCTQYGLDLKEGKASLPLLVHL